MRLFAVALSVLFVAGAQSKDPTDMENSYQNLKKAVEDKDAAQVKKLAAETSAAARAIISSPAPQSDADKETWTKEVAYAKEVDEFTENALYTVAIEAKPEDVVELEQQNPKSKYLDQGYGYYIGCLHKAGQSAKVSGVVTKGLANFPANVELLSIAAQGALAGRRYDQAVVYGDRLVAAGGKQGKSTAVGEGHYIAGIGHFFKNQYPPADRDLKAALPSLSGDQKGCALLYLAVANFNLGNATLNKSLKQQAVTYASQSAAIKSPCQSEAYQRSIAMKAAIK